METTIDEFLARTMNVTQMTFLEKMRELERAWPQFVQWLAENQPLAD